MSTGKDTPLNPSACSESHATGSSGLSLSVITPVLNGAGFLPGTLGALVQSDLPRSRWELIVVDDASTDGSVEVAVGYADRIVRLEGEPRGPAYARNRGAELARGTNLVFVDADVELHADALRLIHELLEEEQQVAAVFGSYDAAPPAPDLVSQYRNLLHHYFHTSEGGEVETFWAGLGAVRADVFRSAGGFDEGRFPRPQIEDIEFGYRIHALGHRILLRPDIQGTHRKRWTLAGMIVTDVRDRGIPWMRLLRERQVRSGTLNLRQGEKVSTALTAVAGLSLLTAALTGSASWLTLAVACLGIVLGGSWPLFSWFRRQRGWWFTLRVVPLRLLYYILNVVSVFLGLLPSGHRAQARDATSAKDAPVDREALG